MNLVSRMHVAPLSATCFTVLCFFCLQRCFGLLGNGSLVQSRYNIDILRNESIEEDLRVLRVAATASLRASDAYARQSRDMVRGWHMFALWLNTERKGIKLNGGYYSMYLDLIDDYSDATLVSKVYKTLLSNYNFFFAPYSTSLSKAAVDVTDPAGKFLMSTAASGTSVFQNRASSFTNLPSNVMYTDAAMAAFKSLGASSTVVIKDVDISACGNSSDSKKVAEKYGLNLYGHFNVNPKSSTYASDVATIISQLKANGIETVIGCTFQTLCYLVSASVNL
jgi:ABC-type branched-subunit amino acid transport system substrate-binding protein